MGILFIMIYLAIVLTVVEINVILYTSTGLEKSVARFQVTSMLTGTGFTTGESELIIKHPIRRKLSTFMILFGAFSLAVIISAISNILADNFYTGEVGIIAGILFILMLLLKTPYLKNKLTALFKHELEEKDEVDSLPILDVMLFSENDEIVEVKLEEDSEHIGKSVNDILKEEADVNLLFISRNEEKIRKGCTNVKLRAGDIAVMYGDADAIREHFKDVEIVDIAT